jgi:hypothetical protein
VVIIIVVIRIGIRIITTTTTAIIIIIITITTIAIITTTTTTITAITTTITVIIIIIIIIITTRRRDMRPLSPRQEFLEARPAPPGYTAVQLPRGALEPARKRGRTAEIGGSGPPGGEPEFYSKKDAK